MTLIRDMVWKHVEPEMKAAQVAIPIVGHAVASQSAVCATIVAMPIAQQPCLFQFDQQGSPEEATANLPFVSIGLGQPIADLFLAFLRRIFWPSKLPTLPEGIFAVLWTLDHAIKTAPGGISEPIQLVALDHSSGTWKARELTEGELQEHKEAIDYAEKTLSSYQDIFRKAGTAAPPNLPELEGRRSNVVIRR